MLVSESVHSIACSAPPQKVTWWWSSIQLTRPGRSAWGWFRSTSVAPVLVLGFEQANVRSLGEHATHYPTNCHYWMEPRSSISPLILNAKPKYFHIYDLFPTAECNTLLLLASSCIVRKIKYTAVPPREVRLHYTTHSKGVWEIVYAIVNHENNTGPGEKMKTSIFMQSHRCIGSFAF